MTLDGGGFTIVGVIPADFDLSTRSFRNSELYVPIGQWKNNFLLNRGAGLGIHGIGRLKPGVSIEQARADMDEVTRNWWPPIRTSIKESAPRCFRSSRTCWRKSGRFCFCSSARFASYC